MELKKTKSNSLKIASIVALAVVIVALAGYGTYAFMAKTWPFSTAKTAEDSHVSSSTPKNTDKSTAGSQQNSSNPNKTPQKYSPPVGDGTSSADTPTSSANTIDATVNYANVTNNTLEVRTTITQLLKSGTCVLTLKNASTGTTTTYTTNIIANPSSSACDGFNVPVKDLAKGDYTISIKLTSGDKTGTTTGKISI